jgi:hypothetical protein
VRIESGLIPVVGDADVVSKQLSAGWGLGANTKPGPNRTIELRKALPTFDVGRSTVRLPSQPLFATPSVNPGQPHVQPHRELAWPMAILSGSPCRHACLALPCLTLPQFNINLSYASTASLPKHGHRYSRSRACAASTRKHRTIHPLNKPSCQSLDMSTAIATTPRLAPYCRTPSDQVPVLYKRRCPMRHLFDPCPALQLH